MLTAEIKTIVFSLDTAVNEHAHDQLLTTWLALLTIKVYILLKHL